MLFGSKGGEELDLSMSVGRVESLGQTLVLPQRPQAGKERCNS